MDKKILEQIDSAIKYIWEYEIERDYDNRYLLKEDTLKNALYFHLRTKLATLFEKHNLRVYTEFTDNVFKNTKFRPDIVIAKINPDSKEDYLGDWVAEIICVIEIKYKNDSSMSAETILKDYQKIEWYAKNLNADCKYYMATIWEDEDDATPWIDNEEWAQDKLTELNASYKNDKMHFYIVEHRSKQ